MLYLVPRRPENHTVEILEDALRLAHLGRVSGVALTLMQPGGKEDHILTGPYRCRPAEAIRAALAMILLLTRIEEERRGAP